VISAIRYIIF